MCHSINTVETWLNICKFFVFNFTFNLFLVPSIPNVSYEPQHIITFVSMHFILRKDESYSDLLCNLQTEELFVKHTPV